MALIGSVTERLPEYSKRKLSVSDAEWRLFETPNGRLVKFSTLGSKERESEPKASQVIHFDRDSARALVAALERAYGAQLFEDLKSSN